MWRYLNEQVATKQRLDSSRGVYVFSDLNPYVGHPNPLKEGQDLFRKGLLSESVLALEAEVLKNPENAEGWRLLGIAHAENDDDQQVRLCLLDDKLPHLCRLQWLIICNCNTTSTDSLQKKHYFYQFICIYVSTDYDRDGVAVQLIISLLSSDCFRYIVNDLFFQFYLT